MNTLNHKSNESTLVLKIIWGSFLFSQILFFVIAKLIQKNQDAAVGSVVTNVITIIAFGFASTVIFLRDKVMTFLVINAKQAKRNQISETQPLITAFVFLLALSESVGLLGFICNIVFADPNRHMLLGLLSVICLIRVYPSTSLIELAKKTLMNKESDSNIKVL
jgi:hypothetical protein